MKNNGLFCTLFVDSLKKETVLDDAAMGRMATLSQTWRTRDARSASSLWDSFMKQAVSYLEFVPVTRPEAQGVYPLFEDFSFSNPIALLYLIEPGADIDDTSVGRFYPAKLLAQLRENNLNWGILTDGSRWRLYSVKSSRPYEEYVELSLAETLESDDEAEYGLFERFFHKDSFLVEQPEGDEDAAGEQPARVSKFRLDRDKDQSEKVLDDRVKTPLLRQVDEVLQYLCNGFIHDTPRTGEDYTEEERAEFFRSAVKLLYRCLFFFYAEARRLLPSNPDKLEVYRKHSIEALCREAHKFRWGKRQDTDQYDLWKHLKGLVSAVNDGDPEYGIMGYDGGLFDDAEEKFLGEHQLRNDFLARALYLLAYVEPYNNEPEGEYSIPYEDLEVRHLGELYENILEWTVQLADADRIRRRTKKGVEILLASQTTKQGGDTLIRKGEVFFGESALERKQTGSYYTPEPLVRFINEQTIVQPLRERFDQNGRSRFNEFLEQARDGHDFRSVHGAAQSAAALVERFAEDEVLKFKVCDPAMGSGHFLVDAANQMAGLIVSLLEEVPHVEGFSTTVSSKPNHWRRKITRHCLYGVDLNPLAVNLAKLSLWLNCFAVDRKLTFLDHHLRPGNSLIGIRSVKQFMEIPRRRRDGKKKADGQLDLAMNFGDLSAVLARAARGVACIDQIDEDETDKQRTAFEAAHDIVESSLRPLADLYTAYLMDGCMQVGEYRALFAHFAYGQSAEDLDKLDLKPIWKAVEDYSEQHDYFHWPVEFPDVFGAGVAEGFSATVGNPPWDVLEPSTQEFYGAYDPAFRKYKKQEALQIIKKLHGLHPHIAEKWTTYELRFQQASSYCKEPAAYRCLREGKVDLYKAFLERFFAILNKNGRIGILTPSGIYTDQSCQTLREYFFEKSYLEFLYCFENRWPTVFSAVDSRFKFVLLGAQKGKKTEKFKCAFMEHDPERLQIIDTNALIVNVNQVRKFSTRNMSLVEFKSQEAINLTSKIYDDLPTLGDKIPNTWNIELSQEFNRSSDSHLFNTEKDGCPLYEGKNIWSFDSQFSPITFYIKDEIVRTNEYNARWRVLRKKKKKTHIYDYEQYRAVFRRIAASTNERTLLSTIIPKMSVCPDTNLVVRRYRQHPGTGHPVENISLAESLYLVSVFNSFVCDFIIRQKITTHLDMHFLYTIPVARLNATDADRVFAPIIARSARLICTHDEYSNLWAEIHSENWQSSDFWYPRKDSPDYGPTHEQIIRQRLAESATELTPEWGPHCGVHDRLPDRRDTGDRAQLRAEIDAYVSHLYGLSRDDFAYILDTFPVLRRKEETAFGEFMSKRKCLEEYDRLAKILARE